MSVYNPRSLKADEFINHAEILETLEYAQAHKDDILFWIRPVLLSRGTAASVQA